MLARTAADLREVEALLRRAQGAPADERLWLLTVIWQLLHEITTDLKIATDPTAQAAPARAMTGADQ